jgi:hypothetical protein
VVLFLDRHVMLQPIVVEVVQIAAVLQLLVALVVQVMS